MTKLIHLTDPHLMPPGKPLYGLDPEAGLAAAISHIAAHHGEPLVLDVMSPDAKS